MFRTLMITLAILCLSTSSLQAATFFTPVPSRTPATEVTLNPSGEALIAQHYNLYMHKGENRIDFSWKSPHLVASSITLASQQPKTVRMLEIGHSGTKTQSWIFASEKEETLPFDLHYRLKKIALRYEYQAAIDKKKGILSLQSFAVLRNDAATDLSRATFTDGKNHIFTGDLKQGEARRHPQQKWEKIPFETRIRWQGRLSDNREAEQTDLPLFYQCPFEQPLPTGRISLYAQKDLTFLGEDRLRFDKKGERLRFRGGTERTLRIGQQLTSSTMRNRRPDKNQPRLFDLQEDVRFSIENGAGEQRLVEMVLSVPGEWTIEKCSHPWKRINANSLQIEVPVKAGDTQQATISYTRRNIRR